MWKEDDNQLVKSFEFSDFKRAFSFVTSVALLAEEMQHHPNWENTYNKVVIRLSTHDAGNKVTEKDKKLAAAIDALQPSTST